MPLLLEDNFTAYLDSLTGLTALVGTKIHAGEAPDKETAPYVVYTRVGGPREPTHDGVSDLKMGRFRLACWSDTYREAKLVAQQVVIGFDGVSAAMGSLPDVDMFVENELDLRDPDVKWFQTVVEVFFWYRGAT